MSAPTVLRPCSAAQFRRLAASMILVGAMSAPIAAELFVHPLDLPQGARIEYLRLYYYDASNGSSSAYISRFDGAGGFADLTSVASAGSDGFGSALSAHVDHLVDNVDWSYVVYWMSGDTTGAQKVCGLRILYTPAEGGAQYHFVAGSALRPRGATTGWDNDPSGGCLAPSGLFFHDGFESGDQAAWTQSAP